MKKLFSSEFYPHGQNHTKHIHEKFKANGDFKEQGDTCDIGSGNPCGPDNENRCTSFADPVNYDSFMNEHCESIGQKYIGNNNTAFNTSTCPNGSCNYDNCCERSVENPTIPSENELVVLTVIDFKNMDLLWSTQEAEQLSLELDGKSHNLSPSTITKVMFVTDIEQVGLFEYSMKGYMLGINYNANIFENRFPIPALANSADTSFYFYLPEYKQTCDDITTATMNENGLTCKEYLERNGNDAQEKCETNTFWADKGYCQKTCHDLGYIRADCM